MRFAVVGGGISGLTAAYRLRQACPDAEITLIEGSGRLGGSLRTVEFGGGPFDVGAEAFVGRRPEVPALLAELGLSEQLVRPSGLRPLIYAGGRLHRLPERTLMGIPGDPDSVRDLVDPVTVARIADEPNRPLRWTPGGDVDVAGLVADRFGDQVVRRSVDPVLGGVYAGLSGSIGVRAALPTLAAALDAGASSLTAAVRAALPPPSTLPVFGGLRDGYRVLPDALVAAAAPMLRIDTAAAELRRVAGGWSLGAAGDGFGAVVLATPAPVTATVLRAVAPRAAAALARIETASSALVAVAVPAEEELPEHSGILVSTEESLRAKAFTLSSRKWPHLAGRPVRLLRASFGRHGDVTPLSWSDAELAAAAVVDLATITGRAVTPVATVVQRWPRGLPQYGPAHGDLVAELRAGLAGLDGIAVAGSYLAGVGVPACIAVASAAVAALTEGRLRR